MILGQKVLFHGEGKPILGEIVELNANTAKLEYLNWKLDFFSHPWGDPYSLKHPNGTLWTVPYPSLHAPPDPKTPA